MLDNFEEKDSIPKGIEEIETDLDEDALDDELDKIPDVEFDEDEDDENEGYD